ncbi:DNA repair protein RecO C-terminal domain-containing protein [Pseudomonas aeruginosa]|nr:DNA repair protein RecO C-terminal domain-containing protein [Pseudomonas aeruginosa]
MPFDPAKPTLLSTLVRHYEELVDHIRRRFGDRGMAREVVHDVCVQLLERDEKGDVHTPLALLELLGYGFALDVDIHGRPIEPQALYQLLPEAGLEPVTQLQPGLFQGVELLSMADADWSAPGALAAAKRLMRQALAPHLGGRPLVSRELFMNRKESPRD